MKSASQSSRKLNLSEIAEYYSAAAVKHGASPKGVDWNSSESQNLRFEVLSRIFEGAPKKFSVLDYGCGYGAYLEYLEQSPWRNLIQLYQGIDISTEMLTLAKAKFKKSPMASKFDLKINPNQKISYVVASGTFNVRLAVADPEWEAYIFKSLDEFWEVSENGFAFNILSRYSDVERRKDHLFYADALDFFSKCRSRYSRFVSLHHDYPLYEFTMIVRKHE